MCKNPTEEFLIQKFDSKIKDVPKKQIIYFPDEKSTSVFLIKKGKVKISRLSSEGKEIIIAILGPGEIFGESAITDTNSPREEFAVATEDTLLCLLFSDFIHELMANDADFSLKIVKIIAYRLKKVQSRLESMIFKSSDERVKSFIKELALEEGVKNNLGQYTIKLKLTHDDIGKLTCTSRQTVTTVMNELERKEYISFDRSKIVVKNYAFL